MKTCLLAALAVAMFPLAGSAGELFGTIRGQQGPVGAGATVQARCGEKSYGPVTTDKRGIYRLVVDDVGKCTLTITHDAKTATVDVVSFDSAAQSDVALEVDAAGKLTARRR